MMADILTVLVKEMREIWAMGGGGRRGWLSQLMMLGVFGVLMPLQAGRSWVESPLVLISWAWFPYLLAASTVADAFAGERERHTLETLLASRLSDRAILFGKALAVMVYACGLAWLVLVLGLVTVNVATAGPGLALYSPAMAAGIVAFSVLGSGLAASAGVLISLRAATARQAAQTMSLVILAIFLPIFAVQLLPATTQAQALEFLAGLDPTQIAVGLALFLAGLDAGLLALALARFQRPRLILD